MSTTSLTIKLSAPGPKFKANDWHTKAFEQKSEPGTFKTRMTRDWNWARQLSEEVAPSLDS
jgi:hypothetical protein